MAKTGGAATLNQPPSRLSHLPEGGGILRSIRIGSVAHSGRTWPRLARVQLFANRVTANRLFANCFTANRFTANRFTANRLTATRFTANLNGII